MAERIGKVRVYRGREACALGGRRGGRKGGGVGGRGGAREGWMGAGERKGEGWKGRVERVGRRRSGGGVRKEGCKVGCEWMGRARCLATIV